MTASVSVQRVPDAFHMYTTSPTEKMRYETFYEKEPETIEWIKAFDGAMFVDIGANVGVYTMYAAHLHPDMKIYSFEPVWSNYRRLLANLKINRYWKVKPMHAAVANRTCLNKLYVKSLDVGSSGAQIDKPVDEHNNAFDPVSTELIFQTTLDDLDAMIGPIDYIKIDVDGREQTILGGGATAFRRAKSVLIEVNTDNLPVGHVDRFMKAAGLVPDDRFNKLPNHSSVRRGGNPVNVVYTRQG